MSHIIERRRLIVGIERPVAAAAPCNVYTLSTPESVMGTSCHGVTSP